MPVWPALLLAPLAALAELVVAYALATPACESQRGALLQALSPAFLLLTLAFTALAWAEAWRRGANVSADDDRAALRPYFVARVAVWCGALSSLVVFALWIPTWLLSPCAS